MSNSYNYYRIDIYKGDVPVRPTPIDGWPLDRPEWDETFEDGNGQDWPLVPLGWDDSDWEFEGFTDATLSAFGGGRYGRKLIVLTSKGELYFG